MDSYINETLPRVDIKAIVENYTTDYKLYIAKRKVMKAYLKEIIFGLIVPANESNENLFNALLGAKSTGKNIEAVESEVIVNDRSKILQEMILIKAKVRI